MWTPSDGAQLGPYEFVRKLGRGGMGEVWEAVLRGPGGFRKPVALKLLSPGRVADDQDRDALLREARLGALLQHPNVVGTLGVSEHGGVWVVALELVRGASAAELLSDGGAFPPRALLELALQAAAGLAHAHDAGLVHRDVKPSNLLVDRTGLVRVADLGIAFQAGSRTDQAGTRGYQPPEQLRGLADARSDLYALGMTLLVLGTGGPAIAGKRVTAALVERSASAPGFMAGVERAIPGMAALVARCVAVDPDRRPITARAFLDTLGALRVSADDDSPGLLSLLARVRPDVVAAPSVTPGHEAPTRRPRSGNLTPPRDRFIGREAELARLRAAVTDRTARLWVLVGPGGIGKTRLALEVALAVQPERTGGVWVFDLSQAETEAEVCGRIAHELGVSLETRDPAGQLGRVLEGKGSALVLLDNVEQCVDALPRTLGRWVARAVEATFVCTSRVVPGLVGERLVDLEPLPIAAAVALFRERSAGPIEPGDAADVDALSVALEGVPLAIELAAARVRLLGVARVRARLSLTLLSGGGRDRPERHRSLQASLDASVALLTPSARAGLAILAVFEGGFTLEAAEAVLVASPGVPDGLAIIEELCDASLLRARTDRFSMLRLVQQYATSTADPDLIAAAEAAHGAWFSQLGAPDAIRALEAGEGRRDVLSTELLNLRAACRRAVARDDPRVAAGTLRASWGAYTLSGPYDEAAALAVSVTGLPSLGTTDRGSSLRILGAALVLAGRLEEAAVALEAALLAAAEAGDRHAGAMVRASLGQLRYDAGQPAEARRHYEAALRLHRELGDRGLEGLVLVALGVVASEQADTTLATGFLEEALTLQRALGNRRQEGMALANLAQVCQISGRPDEATLHYEQALGLLRSTQDRRFVAIVLSGQATLHQQRGELAEAERLHRQAIDLSREVGARRAEALGLANLGNALREQGRLDEAAASYEAALPLVRELGDPRSEGVLLGNLGSLRIDQGRLDAAEASFEAALVLHRGSGNVRSEAYVLVAFAGVQRAQGDLRAAQDGVRAALSILNGLDLPRQEGHAWLELARSQGPTSEALASLTRAEDLLVQARDAPFLAVTLALRASLHHEREESALALAALQRAEAVVPDGHFGAANAVRDARRLLDEARARPE